MTWSLADSVLVLVLYIVIVGSTRSVVSFDSHLYLSSAKSLLTGDVDTWFHWIREPLFPALLKTTNAVFGASDLGYLLTMSALVLASLVVFGRVAFPRKVWLRRTFLVVTALSPLLHGFVGHIGRQALTLSIVVFGAAWALRESEMVATNQRRLRASSATAVVIGAACTLTSLLLLPLASAVAVAPLVIRGTASGISSTGKAWLLAAKPFLPSMVLVVAAIVALGGWWGYKAVELSDNPEPFLRFSGVWAWDYDVNDAAFDRAEVGFLDKIRGLTAFGPEQQENGDEIILLPTAYELAIYGGLRVDWSEASCGIVNPGLQDVEEYVGDYFQLSCRPAWGQIARETLGTASLHAYRGGELALLLGLLLSVWRRRYLVLVLPAAALLLPYMVRGLGISRYGLPLWPLGVAAVAFMIEDIGNWIVRRRRQRDLSRPASVPEVGLG